ncbi:hypothetical protein GQ43DRAFT_433454 [Delitschia confertaspora ATCC 74209]|uniref:Lytic polysaccharide monooxygenase n=1 Tax=Delitschia confertaspora ATCC 74209 TaxID=1513339 RepID=A0A9P4MTT3_9PLEO|nr:hypothetical protein GQ43DRAFT_433454 [Delitschia confertaspora ATCC 74209]
MYLKTISALLLVAAADVLGHMHLHYPPTLMGDNNPYTPGKPDSKLNYPYGCCGQTNTDPCKGHLGLLDTDAGKPVVEWQAGTKVNFTLSGQQIQNTDENPLGGNHYGGSCQVGFSTDKGKTFKVATTWQGNCPLRHGGIEPNKQTFDFVIPADIPAGNAVFAWTWVNREKEFNMNCASVTIKNGNGGNQQQPEQPAAPSSTPTQTDSPSQPQPTGSAYKLNDCSCECPSQTFTSRCTCDCPAPSSPSKRRLAERQALALHTEKLRQAEKLNVAPRAAEKVAFTSRPDMLMYDFAGAACTSRATTEKSEAFELQFPNPGPDVVPGDNEYKLKLPTSCA